MTSEHDPGAIRYVDLPGAVEMFDRAAATQDGWRVPVTGQSVGYLYFGLSDFSFEIWLGGDDDLTVKVEREFTLQDHQRSRSLDPRTRRKADLAPLLDIGNLTVRGLVVTQSGRLTVELDDDMKRVDDLKLVVEPAADEPAWVMSWPRQGPSIVACAAGGELRVGSVKEPWPDSRDVDQTPDQGLAPIQQDGDESLLALPIRGLITGAYCSALTIELQLPIADGGRSDRFDIHLGGEVRITGGQTRDWTGDARGAAVLDLIGASVVDSHMDEAKHLHLDFGDGRVLVAQPETWEAHWPMAVGSNEDVWVPREGPNIQ